MVRLALFFALFLAVFSLAMGANPSRGGDTRAQALPYDAELGYGRAVSDERPACPRCGDFAPLLALGPEGGLRLCRACIGHMPALASEPVRVGSLVRGAFEVAWKVAPVYLPLRLALSPIEIAAREAGGMGLRMAIDATLGLVLLPILFSLSERSLDDVPIGVAVTRALKRVPSYIGTSLVVGVEVLLRLVLLVVPGILRALDLMLAGPLVVLDQKDSRDAIDTSTAWMSGKRGVAAGTLLLLFLLGMVVSMTAGFVLGLAGLDPRGLTFRVAITPFALIGMLPAFVVPYVVYAKARHARLLEPE